MLELKDTTKDTTSERLQHPVPLLPIKNAVLLPGVVLSVTVTRKKSMQLIKKVHKEDDTLAIVTQRKTEAKDPQVEDLYKVGTVAKLLRLVELPDGNTHMIIYGKERFTIQEIVSTKPYLQASITLLPDTAIRKSKKEIAAMKKSLKEAFFKILALNLGNQKEMKKTLGQLEDPSLLVHFIALHTNLNVQEKQRILETRAVVQRLKVLFQYMQRDIKMLEIRNEIQDKTYSDIDQQQRDYFLRQQIKVLQNELGGENAEKEVSTLRVKAEKKKWSQEAEEHFNKEIDRLSALMPSTPEYSLALNYLEFMVNLPWEAYTQDRLDLQHAERILDRNHHGMKKVKDRVIEHLAVLKLAKTVKGSILCLCGPPGVGKTSLGSSIAEALSRKFGRISLGGMHDEAEIRGHRKTYIGAMSGRVLQQISKLKSSNPVIILDEIDKIHRDFRGDPSSALLEVLDPAQNTNFVDNYLEVGYDLSKVLFITTANTTQGIQSPLLDRLEVIRMSGYTIDEKEEIARKHLIPANLKTHGLESAQIRFNKPAIRHIITQYTRESGVRELDRSTASIMRQVARCVATKIKYTPLVGQEAVTKMLGVPRYTSEIYTKTNLPGICTGLAWTETGGELLQIEATLYAGKGKVTLSGQLGAVMQESAMASFSYLRAYAKQLELADELFSQYDLHVHVPSGAVPKDGPSAGITMLTAMASLYTRRRIKPALAMTGELTLSGKVLPVGGIKEKLLAAKNGGIQTLIFSEENRKDVEDLESKYLEKLEIHYKMYAKEVLDEALMPLKRGDTPLRYRAIKHAQVEQNA